MFFLLGGCSRSAFPLSDDKYSSENFHALLKRPVQLNRFIGKFN